MPTSDSIPPRRRDAAPEYSYRRRLSLGEIWPAIGIGVGAGLFAFYVTRLLLQRTPLRVAHPDRSSATRVVKRGSERARRP